MYGLYSRAASNQERPMMARVRYIFFSVLALFLSEIDHRQEAGLFLFSLLFEYGPQKSIRQLAGSFRYVNIVITRI